MFSIWRFKFSNTSGQTRKWNLRDPNWDCPIGIYRNIYTHHHVVKWLIFDMGHPWARLFKFYLRQSLVSYQIYPSKWYRCIGHLVIINIQILPKFVKIAIYLENLELLSVTYLRDHFFFFLLLRFFRYKAIMDGLLFQKLIVEITKYDFITCKNRT